MPSLNGNQLSNWVSKDVYQECTGIFAQHALISYANYYFSSISDFAYIQYLKEIVCEILFNFEAYSEEALANKLVSKGHGEIQKIAYYSDRAQLGTISLNQILAEISNKMKHTTLIGEAARYGMDNVVESLLSSNANSNVGICPPLHRAAMGASRARGDQQLKYQEIARSLLKKGGQVDLRDPQGNTALHFSTYSPIFSKVLVDEGGASLSKWNKDGLTPLDNAQFGSWFSSAAQELSDFLLAKGAKNGFLKTIAKDTGRMFVSSQFFTVRPQWFQSETSTMAYTFISYKINHLFFDAPDGCDKFN